MEAKMGKEIELNTVDETGVLAEIAKVLSEKGIGVLAVDAAADDRRGVFRIMTDDNLRASDALRIHRFEPFEVPVVVCAVPHKPGMLFRVADRVRRAGVTIRRIYATAPAGQAVAMVVLSTADDAAAIVAINKAPQPAGAA